MLPSWIYRLSFLVGLALVLYFTSSIVPEYLFPHDAYFYPRLAQDLFHDGGKLFDWILISAPRFFPDMGIYFFSYIVWEDHLRAMRLAAFLLIALQVLSISLLCYALLKKWQGALFSGAAYLAGCATLGNHTTSVAWVGWHTGTFAIVMLCLYTLIAQGPTLLRALLGVTLIVLVVASNFLAVPVLLSGFAGWFLIDWLSQRKLTARSCLWMVAAVSGCVLGVVCYYKLTPHPFTNPVHASDLSLRDMVSSAAALGGGVLLTIRRLLSEPLFLTGLVSCGIATYTARDNDATFSAFVRVIGFWLAAAAANEFLIAMGAQNTERYRIMTINGSIAVTALSLAMILNRLGLTAWGPLALLAPVMTIGVKAESSSEQALYNRTMSEINCVADIAKNNNLSWGISDFKTANKYSVLSKGGLKLVPIRGKSMRVMPAMVSTEWFSKPLEFVIADREGDPGRYKIKSWVYPLSRAQAESLLGAPEREHTCGSRVLMFYPKGVINAAIKMPP